MSRAIWGRFPPVGIGAVIPGGTQGSILFVGPSGTLTQDNANLFWDDTNNRLGIGTASPTQPLDVRGNTDGNAIGPLQIKSTVGSIGAALTIDNSVAVGGKIYSFISTGPSASSGAGAFSIYNGTDGRYDFVMLSSGHWNIARNFYTDLAQLTVIPTASNVIGQVIRGAASQSANLQEWQNSSGTVLASVNSSGRILTSSAGIGSISGNLDLYPASGYVVMYNATSDFVQIDPNEFLSSPGTSLHWALSNSVSGGSLIFKTNGGAGRTERLSISSTGSIVANESGADADFRIEGDTNANLFFVDASTDRIGFGTPSPGRQVAIYAAGVPILQFANDATGITGGDGALIFQNDVNLILENQETTGTIRVQSTAATQAPFEVRGASGQSGHLTRWLNNAGTALSVVDASGNMGVGTQSPGTRLEVQGASHAFKSTTTGAGTFAGLFYKGDTEVLVASDSYGAFITAGAATVKPLVLKGAASQSANLQEWQNSAGSILSSVDSTGTIYTARVNFESNGNALILSDGSSFRIANALSTPIKIFTTTAQEVTLGTNNIDRLNISGAGTVVFNDTGADADFRIEGDTVTNLIFVDASADSVGFGTSSPSAILHTSKSGTGDQEAGRFSAPSGNPYITIGNGTTSATGGSIVWDDTNDALLIGVHGSTGVIRLKNNSLGVGLIPDAGSAPLRVQVPGASAGTDYEAGRLDTSSSGSPYITVGSNSAGGYLLYEKNNSIVRFGTHSLDGYFLRMSTAGALIGTVNGGGLTETIDAALKLKPHTSTRIGLIIKGASSQSANLLEAQNSSGTALVTISAVGKTAVASGLSTAFAQVGGTIFDHFVDAGNTGTGEDDLYSDTIAASTFATNGDKVTATYQGVFVGAAASTQELRIYFGGTKIYDSGALAIGAATNNWTVNVTCIRVSSSVVRCSVALSTDFGTLFPYSTYTEVTGLTLTNTQILKLTGEAAGVGAADNQIVAKLGYVAWQPAA